MKNYLCYLPEYDVLVEKRLDSEFADFNKFRSKWIEEYVYPETLYIIIGSI